MRARYENPKVEVNAAARRLKATFQLENVSESTWSLAEGYRLGWQLFDPETGLFITEGVWSPLAREISPGGSVEQTVELTLPRERGRYHVYISPMKESGGWFYSQGSPFLLLEASVEHGGGRVARRAFHHARRSALVEAAAVVPQAVYTAHRTGFTKLGACSLDGAPRYCFPLPRFIRRRAVGRSQPGAADADLLFRVRHRAARPGSPGTRAGPASRSTFLAGMLPWLPFSEAAARAPAIVLEHRNFVKKLVFPIEILPVNLTIAGLVTQVFALGVFAVFLLVTRGAIPATALWLPVLIVPQLLLTAGVCWFLAALGVYMRDLSQIIGYLLTLWFFLTPICYPEASLPEAALPLLSTNPMFVLVKGFRDILLEPQAPAFGPLWKLWLGSALICLLGRAWFHKLRKNFADVI